MPSDLVRGPSDFDGANSSLPASLDWRDEGLVTNVKMQVSNTLMYQFTLKEQCVRLGGGLSGI